MHYTFISTLFSCNRQLNPWNDKYDCGCILKSGMDCLLESHRVVTGTCIPIDYWLLLCHVSDLQQNVSSVTRYWSIHSPPHWPVSTRLSSTACMHLWNLAADVYGPAIMNYMTVRSWHQPTTLSNQHSKSIVMYQNSIFAVRPITILSYMSYQRSPSPM